ncbi:hypothetical protein [Pseudomonas sp. SO81]|uniref:hypothetical protein n=1 Tax=Pseudomonas sp. SO81 TaxID=2983246 RepID=UPI0025A3EF48|nr:hypothetical protein [Pseudomonas sp. SO81]WJN60885.1 hypothetical protein OH686_19245 [Pseudomonas sp. SO81]
MRGLNESAAQARARRDTHNELQEMESRVGPIYALIAIAGLISLGIFIWSLTYEPASRQRHSAAPGAVPTTLQPQLGLRRSWVHPLHVVPGYRDEALVCRRG